MAARLVVLVFLHAWGAVCVYGVSLLVTLPALAGTNSWTTTGSSEACAMTSHATLASAAACQSTIAAASYSGETAICTPTLTYTDTVGPTYEVNIDVKVSVPGFGDCSLNAANNWNWTTSGDPCPATATDEFDLDYGGCREPPDCSDFEGVQVDRFFSGSTAGGAVCAAPPGGEAMECGALVAQPAGTFGCAGGECFARLEFSGDECGAEPDVTGEELVDEPGNTNCVSGSGITFCAAQTSQNCGTVNGQSVCLDSIPPGRCTFLGNGGMVCASGASGAPTEEDGVTPAAPDGEFTAGSDDAAEEDYEYFGPGTVANSGTPTSGTSTTIISDGDDGEEPGEEEPFAGPDLGETETFGEALSSFMAAAEGAPVIAAATGIGASLPAGECPAPSLVVPYLGDVELTLDAHCTLWEEIAFVFTAVMLAVWVFIGARIILSA